jgi:hypothetical protein
MRRGVVPPHQIGHPRAAFAPDFAAPRHALLWNGTGIAAGTPVATPDGPVSAEQLHRGSLVLGAGGQVLELSALRHLALPPAIFRRLGFAPPVRIAAGALGSGVPTQPLVLGPAQFIHLAGGWVAAGQLEDGDGVRRLDGGVLMVLPGHCGNLPIVAAGALLAPAGAALHRLDTGPAIATLLRQAPAAHASPLRGFVDHADRFGVVGWALDSCTPERLVPLEVWTGERVVARGLADRPRPDLPSDLPRGLHAGGVASARHGFELRFATPLPAGRVWMIDVRRAGGGPSLPGTPLLLDSFATAPDHFDIALGGLGGESRDLAFLAGLIAAAPGARHR